MGGICKRCPDEMFSPPGSYGINACKPRKACKISDYSFEFTICNGFKNERYKLFDWNEPMICDEHHQDSVKLPEPEKF
jgi:hypothetical protein